MIACEATAAVATVLIAKALSKVQPVDQRIDQPWNAVSAFANCGRAVARVRGSFGPCVDGSGLARRIFTCSVGRSGHVFGLLARCT